jgi:hypothetical protein
MNCAELRERVAAGEPTDAQHLGDCAACRDWAAVLEEAMDTIELPDVEPSTGDWERLNAALESRGKRDARVSLRCTYCHDGLQTEVDGGPVFCATCLAPHHLDCFRANAGCGAPACRGVSTVSPQLQVHRGGKPWGQPKQQGAATPPRRVLPWLVVAALAGTAAAGWRLAGESDLPEPQAAHQSAQPPAPAPPDAPKAPAPPAPPDAVAPPAPIADGSYLGSAETTYALVLAEGYSDEEAGQVARWLSESPDSPVAGRSSVRAFATQRWRQLYRAGTDEVVEGWVTQVRIGGFAAPDPLLRDEVRRLDQAWEVAPGDPRWVREMNPGSIGAAALVCLRGWLAGEDSLTLPALRETIENMSTPIPWGVHEDSPLGRSYRVTRDDQGLLRALHVRTLTCVHRIAGSFVPDSIAEAEAFFAEVRRAAEEGKVVIEMWDPGLERPTRAYVRTP